MEFLNLKALHIIFVVTWFSGLFYIVRLFIYQIEASEKPEIEQKILQTQYKLMAKRLWLIITWPSAILASVFGISMLIHNPEYLKLPWMHLKLGFVGLLYIYHGYSHKIYRQLQLDDIRHSANRMRIFNEGATILLFSIVFLVVLKHTINWVYGVIGILIFGLILMLGIKLYKRLRRKRDWEQPPKTKL